ncbi:MAG: hypothetical protein OHM56_03370 [Spiroplasma phoeniceum]|nr:MAG: hypothetical protein OHM57_02825 [Spiroplasma phoeniceum]UZQ33005.1 MAG: hypothetical protein OHM56_03370 [Spiroplasma phoeniceum]
MNYESNNSVPCRKCVGCKLDNAKEWAIRSALECKSSKDNWFITLTYAGEFLPVNDRVIPAISYYYLRRFVESLRQVFTPQGIRNIRYLASSEYGSWTDRPNYHLCFFWSPFFWCGGGSDIIHTGERSNLSHFYFFSKFVDPIWGKGIHKIGRITYQSAGYVAHYTLKKLGTKLDYEKLGIEPEKLYMSKGIGKNYFDEFKDQIYKFDVVNLNTDKGLFKVQPPRYFDRLYEKQNSKHLEEIKMLTLIMRGII